MPPEDGDHGRRPPLEPSSPALAPLGHRVVAGVTMSRSVISLDRPLTGGTAGREGAQRHLAADPGRAPRRRPHRRSARAPAPGSPHGGSRSPPPRSRSTAASSRAEHVPNMRSPRQRPVPEPVASRLLPAAPCTSTVSRECTLAVRCSICSGHAREDQANDLRRVEVLGHLDRVPPGRAHALRVGAPSSTER